MWSTYLLWRLPSANNKCCFSVFNRLWFPGFQSPLWPARFRLDYPSHDTHLRAVLSTLGESRPPPGSSSSWHRSAQFFRFKTVQDLPEVPYIQIFTCVCFCFASVKIEMWSMWYVKNSLNYIYILNWSNESTNCCFYNRFIRNSWTVFRFIFRSNVFSAFCKNRKKCPAG